MIDRRENIATNKAHNYFTSHSTLPTSSHKAITFYQDSGHKQHHSGKQGYPLPTSDQDLYILPSQHCSSGRSMTEGDGPSRNFRSSYYKKLGFSGNEEKNYLDLLLTSCPFDQSKLNDLCGKFELDRKCIEAWKILLGVECGRKNPFDEFANVRRVRSEHFQMLKHHLEVLLRHNLAIKGRLNCSKRDANSRESESNSHNKNHDHPYGDAHVITMMYLLETGQLDTLDIDSQLESEECRKLIVIANFFVDVSDNFQEAFFLFRNFQNHILNKPNTQP